MGVEPTTLGLRVPCSTSWANGPADVSVKNGVTDGTRTHDHRDHNPGLYQLSYSHHRVFIWRAWQDYSVLPVPHPSGRPTAVQLLFQTKLSNLFTVQVNQNIKINMAHILPYLFYGAPGRTRTCYPRLSLPSTPFDALITIRFVVWTISSPLQVSHV